METMSSNFQQKSYSGRHAHLDAGSDLLDIESDLIPKGLLYEVSSISCLKELCTPVKLPALGSGIKGVQPPEALVALTTPVRASREPTDDGIDLYAVLPEGNKEHDSTLQPLEVPLMPQSLLSSNLASRVWEGLGPAPLPRPAVRVFWQLSACYSSVSVCDSVSGC